MDTITRDNVTRNWFENGKGTSTPWGRADYSIKLTRGVVWYVTPGHGGAAVTLKWARDNLTLQAQYLALHWGGKLWFEEDCKCCILFFEHPHLVEPMGATQPTKEMLEGDVRKWDPDYFDPDFLDACKAAGEVPSLLFLQPGDVIKLRHSKNVYLITQDWYTRGNQRYRRAVLNGQGTWGNNYRITDADVQAGLVSIEREGQIVWKRPKETLWWERDQAANG